MFCAYNNGILQNTRKTRISFRYSIAISVVASIIIGGMIGRWMTTRPKKRVATPINQRFIDKLQQGSLLSHSLRIHSCVTFGRTIYMFRRQTVL